MPFGHAALSVLLGAGAGTKGLGNDLRIPPSRVVTCGCVGELLCLFAVVRDHCSAALLLRRKAWALRPIFVTFVSLS